jgi:hypothetical protein
LLRFAQFTGEFMTAMLLSECDMTSNIPPNGPGA